MFMVQKSVHNYLTIYIYININNKMREDLPSSRRREIMGMYTQPIQQIESSKNNHITQYQNLPEIKKKKNEQVSEVLVSWLNHKVKS